MSQFENSTHQAIDRAFELINLLANSNTPMTIMEISRALKITRTTAYAMVNSLLAQNCLEKDSTSKKYTLGYRFYEIGSQYRYQFPFLNTAEKYINPMYQKWNMVRINVSVLKPDMIAVILLSKDSSLIPRMPHGQVLPAQCSAGGKALLASLDPAVIDKWLDSGIKLPALTPNTITDRKLLHSELAKIRSQGYSTEIEELSMRRACVGAPIRNMSGETIAAASFATSLQHFQQHQNELIDDIILLTNDISGDLGFNLLNRP